MDNILEKSENRFATFKDLHKLVNILKLLILHIINLKHRNIIPTPMKEIKHKVQNSHQKVM